MATSLKNGLVTYSGTMSWCRSSPLRTAVPKPSSTKCSTPTSMDQSYGICLQRKPICCATPGACPSIRKMFGLDRRSHRYLIEPISDMQHIKMALMQRFIGFTEKLLSSRKAVLRNAFNRFKMDCRCTTGANLRAIMLECDKNAINSLSKTAMTRRISSRSWRRRMANSSNQRTAWYSRQLSKWHRVE